MNYLANKLLSLGVTDIHQAFPKETVMLDEVTLPLAKLSPAKPGMATAQIEDLRRATGTDITAQVEEAWAFLVAHAFVM